MKKILSFTIFVIFLINCKSDDKDLKQDSSPIVENLNQETEVNIQIKEFIYNSLNQFYLYQDESFDLGDNRFNSSDEKQKFIQNGKKPEDFFQSLLIDDDRFSFITEDFEELENAFKGQFLSNGLKFRRFRYDNDKIFIVTTSVVKDSPAEIAGIKRGMVFFKINGVTLNLNNQNLLFTENNYSLEEAKIINNIITPTDQIYNLPKIELIENSIFISKILEIENEKIGYLMYNSFVTEFEQDLNNEFAKFKSEGLTNFILDLRYNGGGSGFTANALSSMLTKPRVDDILFKTKWNSKIQAEIENDSPEILVTKFTDTISNGEKINSIDLKKLYVITSKEETASSSELVINSLKPYIDVIVVGDVRGTVGKSQGSFTFYDSANFFNKEGINTSHKYAIQPLVVQSINSLDSKVPNDGLKSDVIAQEDIINLGVLGELDEPLIKITIDNILGNVSPSAKKISHSFLYDGNGNENRSNYQRLYFNLP